MVKDSWQQVAALDELLHAGDLEPTFYKPLLTIQSLTQGLESLNADFSVALLGLAEKADLSYQEILPETLQRTERLFSRRVVLQLANQPVIWAESLCDVHSSFWKEYLNCGTQSLGRKLFSGNHVIERTPFSYRLFNQNQVPEDLLPYFIKDVENLIARQSIFTLNGESLCLTEWYLPNLNAFNLNEQL